MTTRSFARDVIDVELGHVRDVLDVELVRARGVLDVELVRARDHVELDRVVDVDRARDGIDLAAGEPCAS